MSELLTVDVLLDEHRDRQWTDLSGDVWASIDGEWSWRVAHREVWHNPTLGGGLDPNAGARVSGGSFGPFTEIAGSRTTIPMCPKCAVLPVESFDPDGSMMCGPCRRLADESAATEAGDPEQWVDDETWGRVTVVGDSGDLVSGLMGLQALAAVPEPAPTFISAFASDEERATWVQHFGQVPQYILIGAGDGGEGVLSLTQLLPPPLEPAGEAVEGRVYLAGPMSDYPDYNTPAFTAAAAWLRGAGFEVINPAELHEPDPEKAWDWYLRRDLAELVKCTHIVLLPGWEASRGAQLEHHVATALKLRVTYPNEIGWLLTEGAAA
ncbi:hypothetical protein PBI_MALAGASYROSE_52 [Mycobacterium phage MalagasyRose]|uniref:Uncharacterized protein n=1 Tax=Mycobacterium phage MalagasyRose TaxID=2599870 RepID=A0A5J6TDL3_9CAUD|nr:hypothetical protein QEH39_gp36 [Mycobacterium phage MalagasyRose]QFG08900.1 hypothetical protein PBI_MALAGASYROSE_52 [Mycobacterium phage MalagasyRose]